ncbi:type I-D CRISPR-associated protein Cas5/Csc1 [Orenia metallireducens]|uniref:Type I-D CRISPR-associated protein Cas5/Csc1 n=1 Tax=Orenia metallireducens TaxID=1413210 RepID=A0A1C0A8E5_9FIRM|nr:type I-D CRISPR-associated protein Cas5/Csc1 [Orenia metallireducens]OCL26484.1 type I-D CRISPR-associated protein Cas5/Csc1 [Orenia metallireducens]
MRIYRCKLEMYDYLFYATTERGKIAETGAYIHNYALTYALSKLWADKSKLPPRYHQKQQPKYKVELNSVDFYVTPAKLIQGKQKVIQYNTINEGYTLSKGRSLGYPNWGYIKPFLPGSRFEFYILSEEELEIPRYIRLGKFMGKAKLTIEEAESVMKKKGKFTAYHLLNWEDLKDRPEVFDILPQTLPTQLIENAHYLEGRYWEAKFGKDKILLPEGMDYLWNQ